MITYRFIRGDELRTQVRQHAASGWHPSEMGPGHTGDVDEASRAFAKLTVERSPVVAQSLRVFGSLHFRGVDVQDLVFSSYPFWAGNEGSS